jgi:hypothetical protein
MSAVMNLTIDPHAFAVFVALVLAHLSLNGRFELGQPKKKGEPRKALPQSKKQLLPTPRTPTSPRRHTRARTQRTP